MKAVEIKNVTKQFGSRTIINNFSLDIEEGEFVAIIGKSGCGKSTLLNMIGLLESVDLGEIRINNQKLPAINSRAATLMRRNTINYLFQSYALISNMTVKDNLLMALQYVKEHQNTKIELVNDVLKKLEIETLINDDVNTLSGGEQQRVAVARTILKPGDIILADEPTGSLDPNLAHLSFNLVKDLRDTYKKTVVLVTHNMEQAQQADRIINLNDYSNSMSNI
ncbi:MULTISPECIES: ATP-binding cassette domain-containing protein [Nosocomiicoccus]|uniref:ATP-binding cassette domain-containing protein n=1 Tax=Nosocomiicoccus TaxID=489909 RepID=UPI00040DFC9D|nr:MULTISPECIES: ATP-binding cassette domain-containing protein [Nosocomiicoccus]MDK6862784.1 ATP-binding cassette domain-containing protein [Nosocomiicoccus ampullae]